MFVVGSGEDTSLPYETTARSGARAVPGVRGDGRADGGAWAELCMVRGLQVITEGH